MGKLFLTLIVFAWTIPTSAEPVPNPDEQCPILIAQVEQRLESSPPQDIESIAQARQLLLKASKAQAEGDFRICMSKIRLAFKYLNET